MYFLPCIVFNASLAIQATEASLSQERELACSYRHGKSLWGSMVKRAGTGPGILKLSMVGLPRKGPEDKLRYGGYLAWESLVLLCLTDGFWEGLQKEGQVVPMGQSGNKVDKS